MSRVLWAALIAAAGFTSWLIFSSRTQPPGPRPVGAAAEKPDYTLHDAVSTRYDDSGTPRYVLQSASIVHMPVSGTSRLQAITFHYYAASGAAWELVADRGKLTSDGDRLALAGDVKGRELGLPDPIRFTTTEATVEFENRLISSESRVDFWQNGYALEGTGLRANLESGEMELLHDVTGRYAP